MKIEIKEGYDIVLTAENATERKQLGHLNDKYQSCGLVAELLAGADFCFQMTIRPTRPEDEIPELGG